MKNPFRAAIRHFSDASITRKYLIAILLLTCTLVLCGAYICERGYRAAYNDRLAQTRSSFIDRYETFSRFEKRMLHLANMVQLHEQLNDVLVSTKTPTFSELPHNKQLIWQTLYTMLDSSGDYACRLYVDPALGIADETSLILSLDSVRDAPWAREALTGWGWRRFLSAQTMGATSPALVAPIRDLNSHDRLVALLRIDLRPEAFERMLALTDSGAYLACYLETTDGTLVYASRDAIDRMPAEAYDQETVVGFAAARLNQARWGSRTLYYQTLANSRWRLVLALDEAALRAELLPDYLAFLLIGLLIALCGVLFALPVIWSTAWRIRRFYRYVQHAGQNGLGQRLEPLSGDEVGRLITAHNDLLDRVQALMDEREAKERELRRLELSALQAQIKPHFLYNTLEAITWMARRDEGETVARVVRSLTRFYRLCLSGGADVLTVEKELEIARNYFDIQSVRYHGVFQLETEVDGALLPLLLPKITLQPLIENALMHGILESGQGAGTVRVYSRVTDGVPELCVADSGAHFTREGWEHALRATPAEGSQEGSGLMDVERRLCLLMSVDHVLYLDDSDPAWTCVALPFRK